jgi:hypothetical protein
VGNPLKVASASEEEETDEREHDDREEYEADDKTCRGFRIALFIHLAQVLQVVFDHDAEKHYEEGKCDLEGHHLYDALLSVLVLVNVLMNPFPDEER